MRLFLGSDEQIAEMVEKAVRRARQDASDSMTELLSATDKLKALKEKITELGDREKLEAGAVRQARA